MAACTVFHTENVYLHSWKIVIYLQGRIWVISINTLLLHWGDVMMVAALFLMGIISIKLMIGRNSFSTIYTYTHTHTLASHKYLLLEFQYLTQISVRVYLFLSDSSNTFAFHRLWLLHSVKKLLCYKKNKGFDD